MFDKVLRFLGLRSTKEVDLDFLFAVESKGTSGPILPGQGRDLAKALISCQVRDCERHSSFTVLTTAKLDVFIPGSRGSFLRNQGVLPTYQEYQLCDRHMDELSNEHMDETKFIVGSGNYTNLINK